MVWRALGSVAFACSLVFVACGGRSTEYDAGGCLTEGKHLAVGQSYNDGCNTCTCTTDGFECTAIYCGPDLGPPGETPDAGGTTGTGASGGTPSTGTSGGGGTGGGSGGVSSATGGVSSATGGVSSATGGVSSATGGTSNANDFGGAGGELDVACTEAPVDSICIVGRQGPVDDELNVGDVLVVEARPAGCYSSSCTTWPRNACSVTEDSGTYTAAASFCEYESAPLGSGCTADCGGYTPATCRSPTPMTAGTHRLVYQGVYVDFTVPSVVPHASLCVGPIERP